MAQKTSIKNSPWFENLSRSGYFFGALLLHLIVLLMVATWVIFPAVQPPAEDFTKTYLPPAGVQPPPPPVNPLTPQVSTRQFSAPLTITAPTAAPVFIVPMPYLSPATTPVAVKQGATRTDVSKPNGGIPEERLVKIMETEKENWGRSKDSILESHSDPKNITAKFPVYLAAYAGGDWGCNIQMMEGQIAAGSLPDLVAKINEWSHGNITGEVEPMPLNINGPDLLTKKPPFIFFTGHKDFQLTDREIQNLAEYLQIGGCIWGDNALAGKGSRFDVAFRREMKRVVPDLDKNFEPMAMQADVFTKSWFPISKLPEGMNYHAEPIEHLDIDGKVAILYTPNDYSDMYFMYILPGDTQMGPTRVFKDAKSPLFTNSLFWGNRTVFFRNFELPSCLAAQQLGMNIVGYLLVRFDKELMMTP